MVTRPGAPPPGCDSFGDSFVPPGILDVPPGDIPFLADGTRIAGRFEVVRMLGKGGMGAVYECHDHQLERRIAMKQLLPKLSGKEWGVQRFLNEAKAVAAITHANVIQVYDIIEDITGKYIVMEFVDGETLAQRLRREGSLSVRETTRVMLQMGLALDAAHRRGIIHRDIKPGNIMLTANGQCKLGDFGIAQTFGANDDLTHTGTAMGTWVYAAPEQLADAKHVDRRADLYSLGATMYEMLTGEIPRHISTDRTPESLRPVVKRCLAKNPADRFQSAEEFVKGLTEAFTASQKREQSVAKTVVPPPPTAIGPTAAATQVSPGQGAGNLNRRRRVIWQARGTPLSAPISIIMGFALLLGVLATHRDIDFYAQTTLDSLTRALVEQQEQDGSVAHGDEAVALRIVSGLRQVPWVWVGVALGAGFVLLPSARRISTRYRLSTNRFTVRTGVLLRRENDILLTEIQGVNVAQGFFGRIFNYGRIEISRGFGDSIILDGVPDPSALRNYMLNASVRDE